ncbi:MAG: aminodeoxychorismate lyase [Proteobacteria bacterium]|nr:aminodeoxychorismate lyase [Pseudomonadota bacterium]
MLVNGVAGNLISIRDRGLLYGDGVFRTLRVLAGQPQHWPLHYKKLQHDCAALGMDCPDFDRLSAELSLLLAEHPDAVFKVIVTRGLSARGYTPASDATPTHIWDVTPLPVYPGAWATQGITMRLCELRLSSQPRLAGIKHLNRLENVLAAAECTDVAEGLLLDANGLVIEGVRSNVFMISGARLITPDLSRCGVAGVQRDRVIAYAGKIGMPVEVRDVELAELSAADELFLTNSVFGIWPVAQFERQRRTDFSHAIQIRAALEA